MEKAGNRGAGPEPVGRFEHVDSITPQGRELHQGAKLQDKSEGRAGGPAHTHAPEALKGQPEADTGAPVESVRDKARTSHQRVKDPAQQGEGHDERGNYGRSNPSYEKPEDYGALKNQK